MSKHTAGPWEYAADETNCDESEPHVGCVRSTVGSGLIIADLSSDANDFESGLNSKEQAEANGRLIAAAPTMLEALKVVSDDIWNHRTEQGFFIWDRIGEKLQAAIKLAEVGE